MTAEIAVDAAPWPWPVTGPTAPSAVALLVIDLQRDFLDDQGWFARVAGDVSPLRAIVPAVASVLRAARAVPGLTVVHTRQGNAEDLSDLPRPKRAQGRLAGEPIGGPGPLGRALVRGQPGWSLVEDLAPAEGEVVCDKPGFSAFEGTTLHDELTARGVTSLILTGVTANVCVLSTLLGAVDRGYDCLVVSDAVAAIRPALTATVLDLVRYQAGLFGSVAPASAVVEGLRGRVGSPA